MESNMNSLYERAGKSSTSQHRQENKLTEDPVTLSNIDDQLGCRVGRPDMGMIKNWKADRHSNQEQLDIFKKVTSEKNAQLSKLAVEALKNQAELIREQLRTDWNHQYAALSERAAVGEMTVIRKLESVFEVGRDLLYGDRANMMELIEKRYNEGLLSDDDFKHELGYIISRYDKLRDDFEKIINHRGDAVRNSFRS